MADYILTPFYKTRLDVRPAGYSEQHPASGCTRMSQSNYTPYQLFALKSRLQPLVNKRFAHDGGLIVIYHLKQLNNKIRVVVKLYDGKSFVTIGQNDRQYLQAAVDYITGNDPDLVLLLPDSARFLYTKPNMPDSAKTLLSGCWYRTVITHLSFSPQIRGHYRHSARFETPGIYIDLSRVVDYQTFFDETYLSAISRVKDMFSAGYISLPSGFDQKALAKWQVVPVGLNIEIYDENIGDQTRPVLFQAKWFDLRLSRPVGGMVPFLRKHLVAGSDRVLIEVGGDDAITRHRVAKRFEGYFTVRDYTFKGKMVEVEVENLAQAQRAASLVQLARSLPIGKVIAMHYQKPEQFNFFLYLFPSHNDPIQSGLVDVDMIGYVTDDPRNKYCLSCRIPYHANFNYYYQMLHRWYRNLLTDDVENILIEAAPPTISAVPLEPLALPPGLIKIPPIELPPLKPLEIKPTIPPSFFPAEKERITLAPAEKVPAVQPALTSMLTSLLGLPTIVA